MAQISRHPQPAHSLLNSFWTSPSCWCDGRAIHLSAPNNRLNCMWAWCNTHTCTHTHTLSTFWCYEASVISEMGKRPPAGLSALSACAAQEVISSRMYLGSGFLSSQTLICLELLKTHGMLLTTSVSADCSGRFHCSCVLGVVFSYFNWTCD